MQLDQNTLFFAAGICSLAVALTIMSAWYQNRNDRFLLWGAMGMILLGAGAVFYYSEAMNIVVSSVFSLGLETVGFVFLLVGARHIASRPSKIAVLGPVAAALAVAIAVPVLLGHIGVGLIVFNLASAVLLVLTARQYVSVYREAPVSVIGIVSLYVLTAVSFFLCAAMLVYRRQWDLPYIPNNWAEDFNAIMAIVGITGIGALSLNFTQSRVTRKHAIDARTDSLTGLLNRRALYEHLEREGMRLGDSVVVFDLDAFKSINDGYGHSAGDQVLFKFADILRAGVPENALTARIGGEEFVAVFRQYSNVDVMAAAEQVRRALAAHRFHTARGVFTTTTSAGIAFLTEADSNFEIVFRRADGALYCAKERGRDRVCTELHIVG